MKTLTINAKELKQIKDRIAGLLLRNLLMFHFYNENGVYYQTWKEEDSDGVLAYCESGDELSVIRHQRGEMPTLSVYSDFNKIEYADGRIEYRTNKKDLVEKTEV